MQEDKVNHPKHYTQNPSRVECFEIARRCDFARGNCIKYIWRHMDKGTPVEDLKKALWYLERCNNSSKGWCHEMDKVERLDPFGLIIGAVYFGQNKIARELINDRIKTLEIQ